MTIEELCEFIINEVPNFRNVRIVQNGTAFHYSQHFEQIRSEGHFLGAPIDKNLDRTQDSLNSPAATHNPGVVFAYETEELTRQEGFGCSIIRLTFRKAIIANHIQENELDNSINNAIADLGLLDDQLLNEENIRTVLILNTDIVSFEQI